MVFSKAATTVNSAATATAMRGRPLQSILDGLNCHVVTSMGMEIGIIGPGAVGTVLGGLLCAAGHRVTFYGRATTRACHSFTLEDGTGRQQKITGFSWATLDGWNPGTQIALVCVRGDE